ncbi:DUF2505 domain-containing protein [Actinopolymorpha alba]|uniref:DUF2505 domain-containing protein n=1 Tax=Actinopolymorpha alba TaxID=533267 RepID=UPI000374D145|nr:DUF2505 domain-containing protein [Actinopolymorpha alba]
MDLHRETRYAADPTTVFAMLTSESFIRKRAQAAHAIRYDVTVESFGAGARSRTHQSLPAEVPDFVRRLVGECIELDEVITWGEAGPDASRSGELRVDIANAPVTMRGTIQLIPEAGGTATRQIVDAELKASVPLIGKKIEEAAAPAVIAGLDGMEELGRSWLSGNR